MHGWNLVMHGRLHNFDDDEKGIVDKLAMSTQSCILDQYTTARILYRKAATTTTTVCSALIVDQAIHSIGYPTPNLDAY